MAVKFPLKMADGAMVRTIEELREHFDLEAVLAYYDNGRLAKWLKNGYYDEEAKRVGALADSASDGTADIITELCGILGVNYSQSQAEQVHFSSVVRENKRLERLKQYTADDAILAAVDRVAFDQEELVALLNSGATEVYLCGDRFIIPEGFEHVTYQYVNAPAVNLGRIMELEKGAKQGYAEVQYNLGRCYAYGDGIEQNDEEAVKWYRLAAEQGYAKAQYNLGRCYNTGRGAEENDEEAMKWYRLAAEQGYAKAQYSLGRNYEIGCGVEQNFEEAVKWCRLAAEQGYAEAQYSLGRYYDRGRGIEANLEEAVKWYRLAAEQGNAEAQYELGNHYFCYGLCYPPEDRDNPVKWFRLAAEQGYDIAQHWLAECYEYGWHVQKDLEEAKKWYKRAAEQGDWTAESCYKKLCKQQQWDNSPVGRFFGAIQDLF